MRGKVGTVSITVGGWRGHVVRLGAGGGHDGYHIPPVTGRESAVTASWARPLTRTDSLQARACELALRLEIPGLMAIGVRTREKTRVRPRIGVSERCWTQLASGARNE